MRRHAAGVSVLTLEHEGRKLGVTIGSLVSVALEPPLVAVSIGHHSPVAHAAARGRSLFAQPARRRPGGVAQHFARGGMPPLAAWTGIAVRPGDGPPLLEGSLAWLRCSVGGVHEAGDHSIVVGAVDDAELGRGGQALVYVDGEYRPA